jgi:K+-sensing histidine kinase KdpD
MLFKDYASFNNQEKNKKGIGLGLNICKTLI